MTVEDRAYYYSRGRRIPVTRLRSARVLRDARGRGAPPAGWHVAPLATRDYQILLRADVVPDEAFGEARFEDLGETLVNADRDLRNRGSDASPVERDLQHELGGLVAPLLIEDGGTLLIPTGEVVAAFPATMSGSAVRDAVGLRGGQVVRDVDFLPDTYVLRPREGDGLDLAAALVEDGIALYASPNFIEEIPPRAVGLPPNALFGRQWYLHDAGRADIRAAEAWEVTTGSPDITICILDNGVDSDHEAFSETGKLVPGFDFQDEDVVPDPTTSSHGTSCAGLACAPWGRGQVVGVAPGCRVMAIRRATVSEHLKMAQAFAWAADHGADVINCSFGYDHRPWVLPDVVRAAIDRAVEHGRDGRGCCIVWAAGNGDEDISSDEWASYDPVIAVAASTDQDRRAPYSDHGRAVHVCAPSSGGRRAVTTTSNGGYTHTFGGTSSAAPLVAGVIGLMLSVDPQLTAREVKDLLRFGTDRIDADGGAYDDDGHSVFYGYGRVNAVKALRAIPVDVVALRGSPIEHRLPQIRAFVTDHLRPRLAGPRFLQALDAARFRVVHLLAEATFRRDCVAALDAVADAAVDLAAGRGLTVSAETWSALERIVTTLARRSGDDDRSVGDPRFPETPREELDRKEPNVPETDLDDVLGRLTDLLEGGTGPRPQPPEPRPNTPTGLEDGADLGRLREVIAEEFYYNQLIPPLPPTLLLDLPQRVQEFVDELKRMQGNPLLAAVPQNARTLVASNADGAVPAEMEAEISVLARRLGEYVTGPQEDRNPLAGAALIAAAIGAAAAGAALGAVIYEVLH